MTYIASVPIVSYRNSHGGSEIETEGRLSGFHPGDFGQEQLVDSMEFFLIYFNCEAI